MYAAYLAIADHINKDPAVFWQGVNDFRSWHNNDWHHNFERMGIARNVDYRPMVQIFHDIYDPSIAKFSWVEEILDHLAQKQHVLAVLSGAKSNSVRATLESSLGHFSAILGSDHVEKIKPDPEGIHLIMDKIGICADDTVMIGDSDADILAGKNAGVKTAGVTWGMADLEEIEKLHPDFIFHDPMELKAF